jgi:hypothetical protein
MKKVNVSKVRSFIKEYYCLDEGETNNFLCEFDKKFGFDTDWL